MARAASPPEEALRSIARQVSDRLPNRAVTSAFAARTSPTIAETLPIYVLDRSPEAASELDDLAHATPYWHHQLRIGALATSFVRSMEREGYWDVVEIASSDLEAALDEAVRIVDDRLPGDEWEARLLIAPAYYVTAVWLKGPADDRVMIISASPRLSRHQYEIYPADRFLGLLNEQGPAAGVPLIE